MPSDLTLCQRFSRYREKKLKVVFFFVKCFSVTTFDSVQTQHLFCQHHVSLVRTRRMIYNLTLKGYVENLTSGQGPWPDPKRSRCISVDPYRRPEHMYGVSIALAGSWSKSYCRKTTGGLPWPEMTLATWRGVTAHRSQYSESGCQVYL